MCVCLQIFVCLVTWLPIGHSWGCRVNLDSVSKDFCHSKHALLGWCSTHSGEEAGTIQPGMLKRLVALGVEEDLSPSQELWS